MDLSPVKLTPAIKDYIWGGRKLIDDFNKKTTLDRAAESWELSTHPDGQSIIKGGDFDGKTLTEYISENGSDILGENAEKFDFFPILIKLIDAKENLSIQVHPDDEYALKHEGEYGKTEMWYIIDCMDDAYLYYGLNRTVTKEEFLKYVNEDYHVISTAEKNLRNYLKGKYGKELETAAQAAGTTPEVYLEAFIAKLRDMGTDVGKGGAEPDPQAQIQFVLTTLRQIGAAFENIADAKEPLRYAMELSNAEHLWCNRGFSADGLAVRMAAEKKNTDIAAGLLNQGKANGQVVRKTAKIYPNDPCPCGSGKKYKKCCGKN